MGVAAVCLTGVRVPRDPGASAVDDIAIAVCESGHLVALRDAIYSVVDRTRVYRIVRRGFAVWLVKAMWPKPVLVPNTSSIPLVISWVS